MPAVRSTSEGNRRREPWSASRSPLQNPEGVKRQRQADHIERLARAHRDAPNGTRIGLYWNYVKEKNMAYIKDHFSGAIRPAIMKDDMYSNMSEEELEWHRQWYLRMKEQAKAEQAAEAQKEDENKGDASKVSLEDGITNIINGRWPNILSLMPPNSHAGLVYSIEQRSFGFGCTAKMLLTTLLFIPEPKPRPVPPEISKKS